MENDSMKKSGKLILKFLCLICVLQILLTVYLILKVYVSNVFRPDQLKEYEENAYNNQEDYDAQDFVIERDLTWKKDAGDQANRLHPEAELSFSDSLLKKERELKSNNLKVVEVWGKAAIASYFWEHVLEGVKSVDSNNPSIYSSSITTPKCILHYKEGPGLQLAGISSDVNYLVLVLNGRTPDRVAESQKWIEHIGNLAHAPKLILMILGDEKCNNQWVHKLLFPKGPVNGVFITYDDPSIDEEVLFQWPLGVATYRQFPLLNQNNTNPSRPRKFICNLQATNHPNTTRNLLFSLLKSSAIANKHCAITERERWKSSETLESSREYLNLLLQSDLTLCPAGFNTETYRVYEALSAGSVPVIEDSPSKGSCDSTTGWRILKKFAPPVIWIKDWNELPSILENEQKMPMEKKLRRRKKMLNWYEWFKVRNKDRFLAYLYKLI